MAIQLDQSVCTDLAASRRREWLETNGIGGFASSTLSGLNTRRYHGLLVAATRPPVGRVVMLSKLEETLVVDGRSYDLGTNQYPGALHPTGYLRQESFRLDPMPVAVFRVGDLLLEKTVFMVHDQNSTAVRYRLLKGAPPGTRLELRPLIAFRDYHSLTHHNSSLNPQVTACPSWLAVTPYPDLPALYLNHNGAGWEGGTGWYYRFELSAEQERGLDAEEDLFNPLVLHFDLDRGEASVIASTQVCDATQTEALQKAEVGRRAALTAGWEEADETVQELLRAADQFVVRRGDDQKTVIAGYHWFTDWGRDTMIAFPGLTLVPRRFEEARQILLTFARSCDRGMLPNRFPDAGEEPEYNTVDATLWFFQAVHEFVKRTGDTEFVLHQLYGTLQDILRWHMDGTRYDIRMQPDGLLHAGGPETQLTWMDARVGDRAITPRWGKPVEIQALWYNALRVLEKLAREFDDQGVARRVAAVADRARESFNAQFWNADARCLYDCVSDGVPDASIRPNQIFAVSLPFSMLSEERMRDVVDAVSRELLTPVGLRTLAPSDPAYQGLYGGDPGRRDGAYHQGTVWPWLLGPYITARVRAGGGGDKARREAGTLLEGLRAHLRDAGLGTISEIFDGDPPHEPKGCIAQAWSVAEILRAAVEDTA